MFSSPSFSATQLISIADLSDSDIATILKTASRYADEFERGQKKYDGLKGRTIINLFYEGSTRTRTSFELAGKRLGADVINISVSTSSTSKGESFIDTIQTLDAMGADAIVLRHGMSGAARLASQYARARIINAGDGCHQHPTQALLDALTIQRRKGAIRDLTVAICGDILHSRVARSNIALLSRLGAKIRLIAPPTLLCLPLAHMFNVSHFTSMDEGLKNADVIMMLRMQRERMNGSFVPSMREYFHLYGLSRARLALAKPDAIVLHPGPINRGVEIASDMADDPTVSCILSQVSLGVSIRQAVLQLLLK